MARQLAKKSPGLATLTSLTTVFTALRGKPHFHTCGNNDCRLIYEDNCTTPERNGDCQACRGLRRPLTAVRDPQECCINNCGMVVSNDDLIRYSLAGPGPWYQCLTCRRAGGWPCNF